MSVERFVFTYRDIVDYLRHATRGLRALNRAEAIAARDAERLRVAETRIKNATDRLRAAILVMGIGDTRQADREVRGALENLTAKYPEMEVGTILFVNRDGSEAGRIENVRL